jgi:hypothetical protein
MRHLALLGLLAAPLAAGDILLDWPDSPAADVVLYRVHRSAGTACPVSDATLVATVTTSTWADAAVTGGRQYSYVVVAVDRSGHASAPSPVATAIAAAERTIRLRVDGAAATASLIGGAAGTTDAQGYSVFTDLTPTTLRRFQFLTVDAG